MKFLWITLIGLVCSAITAYDITLKIGRSQDITLAENPSTGYAWYYVVANYSLISISPGEYKPAFAYPIGRMGIMSIGKGGTRTFRITGQRVGTAHITFTLARVDSFADRKIFTVKVVE